MASDFEGNYKDFIDHIAIFTSRFDITIPEAFNKMLDAFSYESIMSLLEEEDKLVKDVFRDVENSYIYRHDH